MKGVGVEGCGGSGGEGREAMDGGRTALSPTKVPCGVCLGAWVRSPDTYIQVALN